jgi:hypothetical protein
MNKTIFLLLVSLQLFRAHPTDAGCLVQVTEDIDLLHDYRDSPANTNVLIDIYRCDANQGNSDPPLVVLACGGPLRKAAYNTFARGLAQRNNVVIVIDHPVMIPYAPPFNFADSYDFANAIQYAKDAGFPVDANKIVLMGHSFGFGSVLRAINKKCLYPYTCKDPNTVVSLDDGVVLTVAFGASLVELYGPNLVWSNMTNEGLPMAIINGDGDWNYFGDFEGDSYGPTVSQETFNKLKYPKVSAAIHNLDHFSISDLAMVQSNGIPSTLPREQQIRIVADVTHFWIQKNLDGNPTYNFCSQLSERGGEIGYVVLDCSEEYSP